MKSPKLTSLIEAPTLKFSHKLLVLAPQSKGSGQSHLSVAGLSASPHRCKLGTPSLFGGHDAICVGLSRPDRWQSGPNPSTHSLWAARRPRLVCSKPGSPSWIERPACCSNSTSLGSLCCTLVVFGRFGIWATKLLLGPTPHTPQVGTSRQHGDTFRQRAGWAESRLIYMSISAPKLCGTKC